MTFSPYIPPTTPCRRDQIGGEAELQIDLGARFRDQRIAGRWLDAGAPCWRWRRRCRQLFARGGALRCRPAGPNRDATAYQPATGAGRGRHRRRCGDSAAQWLVRRTDSAATSAGRRVVPVLRIDGAGGWPRWPCATRTRPSTQPQHGPCRQCSRHGSVRMPSQRLTWAVPGDDLGIAGDEVLIVADDNAPRRIDPGRPVVIGAIW